MEKFKLYRAYRIMILAGNCPYCGKTIDIELDDEAEEKTFDEECPKCKKEFEVAIPEWDSEWDYNTDDDD